MRARKLPLEAPYGSLWQGLWVKGGACGVAMVQHPNSTPSEHPNLTTRIGRLKWVVNSPTNQNGINHNGFDNHSHVAQFRLFASRGAEIRGIGLRSHLRRSLLVLRKTAMLRSCLVPGSRGRGWLRNPFRTTVQKPGFWFDSIVHTNKRYGFKHGFIICFLVFTGESAFQSF